MDACVMEHGGVAPAAPTARYYPQKPGYQLIAEAVRPHLSVKRFYQMTTQLAPANPLEVAPRWFWMHQVGLDKEAEKRRLHDAIKGAAASINIKRKRR